MSTYVHTFREAGVSEPVARQVPSSLEVEVSRIIGISGKIASGKDTIGIALAQKLYGENYTHMSFGSPLKTEVNMALNLIRDNRDKNIQDLSEELAARAQINVTDAHQIVTWLLEDLKSDHPPKNAWVKTPYVRKCLQYWGTDIRRQQNPDYWTHAMLQQIAQHFYDSPSQAILITDVRFPNELQCLLSLHAYTLRLNVSPEVQRQRLKIRDGHENIPDHPSETALDDCSSFTEVIDNNGEQSVSEVVDDLLSRGTL